MNSPRKKLAVKLLIDDDTMRAIGHVTAQWSFLEIEFDTLLGRLLRHPAAKAIVPKNMPQAFDRRAKLFRGCVNLLLSDQPDLLKEISGIVNDATSARGQRDKVVHGQWHLGRKKGKLGTAVTTVRRRPEFKMELQNMSAEQVENVAAEISNVSCRLIWWAQMNIRDGSEG
ncbi:hypothetical protein SAMN05216374_3043 [Tardiphaga sp. OK246]|jgi:hypothetical protein|uniref:hypothetical protein n=1 Tax=Tardiphaga sp. OK246 TaxID=1855307 RepID=UPI000B671C81|nr:hypothetical protein [Tardiphaga sp. OK246]SNT30470.1 hypothetical protein SAMN05216374_3043 [Tardiphaga sp. OK246]